MRIELGVVVLTHGDGKEATPLVESLLAEGVPARRVVIVHNTNGPALDCDHPLVDVIHPERNLGYTGGMNAGAGHHLATEVTHVLLLTHEVRLRIGCLDRLLGAARPAFGVIGPALRVRDTDDPFSYGATTDRFGRTSHRVERPDAEDGVSRCDWLDGAFLLFRRETLAEIGLMAEKYFIYSEDAEICLRATRAGWGVGCVVDAVAEQRPGGAERPASYWYLSTRNGLDYRRQAAGVAGLSVGLTRAARVWRVHARRARSAPSEVDRRLARAKASAVRAGVLAYLRRSWGPPPEWVWTLDRAGKAASVE